MIAAAIALLGGKPKACPAPSPVPRPVGFEITLPIPPSLNNAYHNVARVGRTKTSECLAWHELAGYVLRTQSACPIDQPYAMLLALPTKMRGDIGNREKVLSDFLVDRGLIPDDSQSHGIFIVRWSGVLDRQCRVIIRSVDPASPDPGLAVARTLLDALTPPRRGEEGKAPP